MRNGAKPKQKTLFLLPDRVLSQNRRTPCKKVGIVYASSREEAETLVWKKHGSDISCEPWVDEVSEEGYEFTMTPRESPLRKERDESGVEIERKFENVLSVILDKLP